MKSKLIKFLKDLILTEKEKSILNNELNEEQKLLAIVANKKEKFNLILNFALNLEKENPHGLVDLMRILLRPIQSELLISSIEAEEHKSYKGLQSYNFFMPNCKYPELQSTLDKPKLKKEDFLIHLNKDPILPCPWVRSRYVSNISTIGTNKVFNKPELLTNGGKWKQDSNHLISLWQPWGLGFVDGGNHSISVGIINGEGTCEPKDVYDMSFLLEIVKCDGEKYIMTETNEILDSVNNIRRAAVFEIGRILHRNKIIPMHI